MCQLNVCSFCVETFLANQVQTLYGCYAQSNLGVWQVFIWHISGLCENSNVGFFSEPLVRSFKLCVWCHSPVSFLLSCTCFGVLDQISVLMDKSSIDCSKECFTKTTQTTAMHTLFMHEDIHQSHRSKGDRFGNDSRKGNDTYLCASWQELYINCMLNLAGCFILFY